MALALHAQLLDIFRANKISLTKKEHEIIDPLEDIKDEPAIAAYIMHVRAIFVLLRTEAHFRMEIMLGALHGNHKYMSRQVASYHTIKHVIDHESMCQIHNPIS